MARMSYAQAACAALGRAMRADPRVVTLGEDVGRGGIFQQYKGLQQEFGGARVIDTPISESTIMGAAVGVARGTQTRGRDARRTLSAMDELVSKQPRPCSAARARAR
jgi:pyruvate dehydrogenase E1 component beta subunit